MTEATTAPEAKDGDVSYRIGSVTRSFAAVRLLQRRDAGLLDLDDRRTLAEL